MSQSAQGPLLQYSDLADFASKYARLQVENDVLRRALSEERQARGAAQATLSQLLDQIQGSGVKVVLLPSETPIAADVRVFAEQAVQFCEQMKDFASHVLTITPPNAAHLNAEEGGPPIFASSPSPGVTETAINGGHVYSRATPEGAVVSKSWPSSKSRRQVSRLIR